MAADKTNTRKIALLCVKGAGVAFLAALALVIYYWFVCPHQANTTIGRIYAIFYRGSHVYLNWNEMRLLLVLGGIAAVLVVVGTLLGWPYSTDDYEKARATYK